MLRRDEYMCSLYRFSIVKTYFHSALLTNETFSIVRIFTLPLTYQNCRSTSNPPVDCHEAVRHISGRQEWDCSRTSRWELLWSVEQRAPSVTKPGTNTCLYDVTHMHSLVLLWICVCFYAFMDNIILPYLAEMTSPVLFVRFVIQVVLGRPRDFSLLSFLLLVVIGTTYKMTHIFVCICVFPSFSIRPRW